MKPLKLHRHLLPLAFTAAMVGVIGAPLSAAAPPPAALTDKTLANDPAQQTPRDVSGAFAAADGVKVTQITDGPGANMLSY